MVSFMHIKRLSRKIWEAVTDQIWISRFLVILKILFIKLNFIVNMTAENQILIYC